MIFIGARIYNAGESARIKRLDVNKTKQTNLTMKCLYLAAVLVVLFLGLRARPAQAAQPTGAVPMRKFKLDLNEPPEKRWLPILSVYNSSGPLILDYFNNKVI